MILNQASANVFLFVDRRLHGHCDKDIAWFSGPGACAGDYCVATITEYVHRRGSRTFPLLVMSPLLSGCALLSSLSSALSWLSNQFRVETALGFCPIRSPGRSDGALVPDIEKVVSHQFVIVAQVLQEHCGMDNIWLAVTLRRSR